MNDKSLLLVGYLETVLGKSKKTSKSNYAFICPFCQWKHPKLEVNVEADEKGQNYWHCWRCDRKGKRLLTLLKSLHLPQEKLTEITHYIQIDNREMQSSQRASTIRELPAGFKSLSRPDLNNPACRAALRYLKRRGITYEDILKYNLGYTPTGEYAGRVIVPIYNSDNRLTFYIGRSVESTPIRLYKNPSWDKNEVVGFENLINWKVPIILCEGVFDAMAIKRNAVPLLGKSITQSVRLKLVQSDVKTVYLALDSDAVEKNIRYAEELLNLGKEVYLVELGKKDPSDIGFSEFTKLLHSAKPLTFKTFFEKKLNLN
jgi:DNA primase